MTFDRDRLPPPMNVVPGYVALPPDPSRPGIEIVADVFPVENQMKAGQVRGFTIRCDEGRPPEGGSAPSPLAYFTTAVGF